MLQKDLDQKERGIADALIAPAVAALVTAWKMEALPKPPTYLLKVASPIDISQMQILRMLPDTLTLLFTTDKATLGGLSPST